MMPSRRITRARTTPAARATAPEVWAERGAILVQVAAMMLGLTALSAFIVDYGILWTARRQIQNTADAAAMAAAVSLAFDAPGDQARARANALTAVAQNPVWGAPAVMSPANITFPPCPVGAVGAGPCVRVEAFRNQASASPLPTVFGAIVGVNSQGVRATATAQVLYGRSSDCVRPLAIPDKWQELRGNVGPMGWDPLDTFDRFAPNGVTLLSPADYFEPPGGGLFGPNGTGFSREATASGPADYGRQLRVAQGVPAAPAGNQEFKAIRMVPGAAGPGGFYDSFMRCSPEVVEPGRDFELEPANVDVGEPVVQTIALDPGASWNPSLNGGRGGVSGGCMAAGTCTVSPRIIAVPLYDPSAWDANPPGQQDVVVAQIAGFFLERYESPYVVGRLMAYPAAPRSSMTADPQSSFVISVTLVR